MRFAQASFRGIHNRQMPPMWVVVEPCRGVVGVTFFNIHFPCVLRPIFRVFVCARCFECLFAPDISPDLRPCVSGGVAPIPTFCPYRARYLLNPVHGGTQGVAVLRPALPWAEIPLPLQGATSSKPSKHCIKLAIKGGDTVAKHGSFEYAGPIHYSEVLKPWRPIQEHQRPVIIRRF